MANLAYRRESIQRILGSVLAPAASYTVTVYPAGAQVSGNQSGTTITVRAGHYIPYGGTDVVVIRPSSSPPAIVSGTFQAASSATATTVVFSSSVTVVDGDLIVPLGADTGSTSPAWDGSAAAIYTDMAGGSTAISSSLVTANSSGEYEYYSLRRAVWEVIRDTGGTVADIVQSVFQNERQDGVFNVLDFGAKGDGTTNDYTAIQAALDAIPSTGGRVFFPAGTYLLNSGLSTSTANMELYGVGGQGQDSSLGHGATRFTIASGVVGFTFNPSAASSLFKGPVLRNLYFTGASGATGGILLNRVNNYLLENVVCADFTTGYGFHHNGTGNVNQYGKMIGCGAHQCQVGNKQTLTNGLQILGGYFDGAGNASSPVAGSTGIQIISGDTTSCVGVVVQGYETGIDVQAGEGESFVGCRLEVFTTGIRIDDTDGASIIGGSFNNSLAGGTGTAISLTSNSTECLVWPGNIRSVTTQVSDAGTSNLTKTGTQIVSVGTTGRVASERVAIASPSGGTDVASLIRFASANASSARLYFGLWNASSALAAYAAVYGVIVSNTAGSHEGKIQLNVASAGTLTNIAEIGTSGVSVTGSVTATGALRAGSADVNVTGNDNVTTAGRYLINLTNVSGTNTITLSAPSSVNGQTLILRCAALTAGTFTLADSGNVALSAAWAPDAGDTLSLVANGVVWYETARSAN